MDTVKWYASVLDARIEEVAVRGETPSFVFMPSGRKEAKVSNYGGYFNTFDEALGFLRTIYGNEAAALRTRLARIEEKLCLLTRIPNPSLVRPVRRVRQVVAP